jgi:FMN-dependent NADH-azoreductase
MSKVLHLDVSPRGDRSVSRTLGKNFVAALNPVKVAYRDLGRDPVPFVTEAWVAGAFNPPEKHEPAWAEAIALSDRLVDELIDADKVVISTPMYNLSVPAALKAWIDQIVRVGRTFGFGDNGLVGLLTGKKVAVIITSGSPLAGTPYDFEEPYLRGILAFIGITDVTFVRVEGFSNPAIDKETLRTEAEAKLATLAQSW